MALAPLSPPNKLQDKDLSSERESGIEGGGCVPGDGKKKGVT